MSGLFEDTGARFPSVLRYFLYETLTIITTLCYSSDTIMFFRE